MNNYVPFLCMLGLLVFTWREDRARGQWIVRVVRQAAGDNIPRFVAGFASLQYVLNFGESSYDRFRPAARLTAVRLRFRLLVRWEHLTLD